MVPGMHVRTLSFEPSGEAAGWIATIEVEGIPDHVPHSSIAVFVPESMATEETVMRVAYERLHEFTARIAASLTPARKTG